MKFNQCYTNVTKVTVDSQYSIYTNQMLQCYSVTAYPRAKNQKYLNYHNLFSCTLKVN